MKSGKQSANGEKLRENGELVAFRAKRNAVTWLMNNARKEFYTNFINENSSDQKKLFNASKQLFNRTRDDGLPPNVDSVAFASDIGKFFVQKIINIRRSLDDSASLHQETIDLPLLDAALPVVEESEPGRKRWSFHSSKSLEWILFSRTLGLLATYPLCQNLLKELHSIRRMFTCQLITFILVLNLHIERITAQRLRCSK